MGDPVEIEQRVRQAFADVLGVALDDVGPSSSRANTAAWDSMKHIEIVMALEAEFDISLTVQEIESLDSYEDVVRVLQAKV